jgi:DNA-binding GntR family transcriptional regulator
MQPIDTTTLHERAYQQLKAALLSGGLKPGEPVTIRGLATDFGTSSMPVREAIRRLVSERALEMPNSRSVRVPPMSLNHFDQLVRTRIALEGEAAGLAATRISPESVTEIARINKEIRSLLASGDFAGALRGNQRFHHSIYAASENSVMTSLIETLWLQAGPYLNLLTDGAEFKGDFEAHEDVIRALRNRDREAARRAMRSDIYKGSKVYRKRLRLLE